MPRSKKNNQVNLAREPVVPTRFRCKVGGEWVPLTSFSNSQRRLIQRQIDGHAPINAANSGMTCRDHSAASRTELRCELCDLVKPISEYSKTSRKEEENICKRCSAWGETQEPDVTPIPLETGHISIEEENCEVWQKNYGDGHDMFAGELPQAPITELATLGLGDDEVNEQMLSQLMKAGGGAEGGTLSIPNIVSSLLPKTGDGSFPDDTSQSGLASEAGTIKSSVPPHLRGSTFDQGSSYRGSSSNPFANEGSTNYQSDSNSAAASRSDAVPPHLHGRMQPSKVAFNAWGPDGQRHQGLKSPTVSSMSTAGAVPRQTAGPTTGRNNWHKGPRLRRHDIQPTMSYAHVTQRHVDPEMDKLRQREYCQTEDSDF